jgi:hypothetical protein
VASLNFLHGLFSPVWHWEKCANSNPSKFLPFSFCNENTNGRINAYVKMSYAAAAKTEKLQLKRISVSQMSNESYHSI